MHELSQETVHHLFLYDEVSGELTHKNPTSNCVKAGAIAGHLHSRGYIHVGVFGKQYKAHRLIWLYMTGNFPEHDIDHIDGNRSNNSWKNLRESSRSQNCRNQKFRGNSSGYKGVSLRNGTYSARIRTKNEVHYLGSFSDPLDAALAYDHAAIKLHGKFAKTNSSLGLIKDQYEHA